MVSSNKEILSSESNKVNSLKQKAKADPMKLNSLVLKVEYKVKQCKESKPKRKTINMKVN